MLGGPPPPGLALPSTVRALADGSRLRPVWVNEAGGLTCEIDADGMRTFVKWAPAGNGASITSEAARMRWAAEFTPVPRVLDQGEDDEGAWLLTEALPGEMAVVDRWKRSPQTAVAGIGAGLRALHDALPVRGCPFSWDASQRIAEAYRRVEQGAIDSSRWHPEHQRFTIQEALDLLGKPPPVDELVVCHGDACAPNTLLDEYGRCTGHVDLGSLGVADRWADLAVATWSTTWNYGEGWETPLLDAYGIDVDLERTRYYRLLWDLSS